MKKEDQIIDVRVNGTYSTSTYIKTAAGDTLKVDVMLERIPATISVRCTVFKYFINLKKYKHRKFEQVCSGTSTMTNCGDDYKKYLSDQLLYECYRQHWLQMNPLRMFWSHNLNGKHVKHYVTENSDNSNTYKDLKWI